MACIVHQGSYDNLEGTYGQLMCWIETNGYSISGPIREVYMQWQDDDPSGNVTEIQLPVEKA
jgi:effector-binding domain-containing protein